LSGERDRQARYANTGQKRTDVDAKSAQNHQDRCGYQSDGHCPVDDIDQSHNLLAPGVTDALY
jgi:hypothetical protein